ncbi:MAG: FAD-dependent monooxygenase [Pseudomonadota bacterium]
MTLRDGDLPALVAGAGIGGLAAALALSRAGFAVRIFERRSDSSEIGAGIQIGPNGVKALRALGVGDAVMAEAAQPNAIRARDGRSGRIVAELPLGNWMTERHAAPYITVRRADLHKALRDAAETDDRIIISYGRTVVGAEQSEDAVAITFDDDTSHERGALLVAADGQNSKLRPSVAGAIASQRACATVSRTTLDAGDVPGLVCGNTVTVWMSARGHLVHYPVARGRQVNVVLVDRDPQSAGTSQASAELDAAAISQVVDQLQRVAPALAGLRSTFEQATWGRWPVIDAAPLPTFARGRIVLLGDAAHPVRPYLAQGAVMALEDAVVLGNCVSASASFDEALVAYDAARRSRTVKVQNAAKQNGQIYHLPRPASDARNLAMRSLGGGTLMQRYDWVYGWAPTGG